jgi:lipopolysaccharide transport system ATP-binding protein
VRNFEEELPALDNKADEGTKINFYEDIANSDGWGSGAAEILSVDIIGIDGDPIPSLFGGEQVLLKIEVMTHQTLVSPMVGFFVKDRLGQALFGENTYSYIPAPIIAEAGEKLVSEFIFSLPLLPNGEYSMTVAIADGDPNNHIQHHWLHDAVILEVQSSVLRYGLVGIPFDSVRLTKTSI